MLIVGFFDLKKGGARSEIRPRLRSLESWNGFRSRVLRFWSNIQGSRSKLSYCSRKDRKTNVNGVLCQRWAILAIYEAVLAGFIQKHFF